MNKDEQLARLLRLKRHETPGEEYFEGFVDEFHAYQRKTLATQSLFSLCWERASTALSLLRRPATAWTALAVYASAMVLIHAWPAPDHARNTTIVIQEPGKRLPSPPSPVPGPVWQTGVPAAQTIQVSDSPSLNPPPPGKRRTTDQPRQDIRSVIGPATQEVPPAPDSAPVSPPVPASDHSVR